MTTDHRELFIQKVASGKSFVEVGGLWGEVNEKATIAHKAGASKISAIDIWNEESEWWDKFDKRCQLLDIKNVSKYIGSIDNPEVVKTVPVHDIAHCAGVLYHCPNPFLTISNLAALCSEYLILTSASFPSIIETEVGGIYLDDDAAISVPALTEKKRIVLNEYITKNYGGGAYGINYPTDAWYFEDSNPNYGPWWWIWTPNYLKSMAEAVGLEVVDEGSQFNGTGHTLLLKKKINRVANFGKF